MGIERGLVGYVERGEGLVGYVERGGGACWVCRERGGACWCTCRWREGKSCSSIKKCVKRLRKS